MRKITKVTFAILCILTISSIGIANAARPIKPVRQCTLVYWTSDDSTKYDVTKRRNFSLSLDGNPDTWYYLDIKDIKPEPSLNPEYSYAAFPFFLDTDSVANNEAFLNYWTEKLDAATADGQQWPWIMDLILQGEVPMFLLKATPTGQYMLVDYLQAFIDNVGNEDPNTLIFNPLRINGDYPQGTYTFTGYTDAAIDTDMIGVYPNNEIDALPNPLSDVSFTITFS